jgi:hypothetical protein
MWLEMETKHEEEVRLITKEGSNFLPLSQVERVKRMYIEAFTRTLDEIIVYVVDNVAQTHPTISLPVLVLFAAGYVCMVSGAVMRGQDN